MSDFAMADISGLLAANSTTEAKYSHSRKGSNELNMEDFLQLMIVQLQNQTIDDTMDTSEMMNQMVQMQMISALTNMTDASVMSYASSLVGKVVTIGITDGNTLEEREILVMGTGTMDGQQVIFGSDGKTYSLNQIMAVGRLPDENGKYPGLGGGDSEDGDGTGGVDGGDGTGGVDGGDGTGGVDGGDGAGEDGGSGEQGAPTD